MGRAGGDGPFVLLLHGISSHHLSWAPVVRELLDRAPAAQVLAVDLRGRGASNGIGGPYGIAHHVEDAVAVLDAAGASRAVVAGHSMGAWAAVRMAVEHPARVSAAILVDGGVSGAQPPGVRDDPDAVLDAVLGPAVARLRMTFAAPEDYVDFWRAHPAFADGRFNADVEAYARYDLEGEPGALESRAREAAVRTDGRDLLLDEPTRSAAGAAAVPLTLLRAERGLLHDAPFLEAATVEAFRAAQPVAEVVEMPGVNHYTATLGSGAAAVAGAIARRL